MPFYTLDLGAEWTTMTGLPMVFAVWAARAERLPQDPGPFVESLEFGLAHLDEIVAQEYAKRQITPELAKEYLTRHIVFQLGELEYSGLDLFLRYAHELRNQNDLRNVSA
jgi:predicted solute-binding protein